MTRAAGECSPPKRIYQATRVFYRGLLADTTGFASSTAHVVLRPGQLAPQLQIHWIRSVVAKTGAAVCRRVMYVRGMLAGMLNQ